MLRWWVCFLHYHRLCCVYLTENLCCLLNILVVCLPNIIETIVFIAIGLIFVDVISLKLIYIARTVIYAKCIDSRIIKDEAFSLTIQRRNIFVYKTQRSILARYIGTIYSQPIAYSRWPMVTDVYGLKIYWSQSVHQIQANMFMEIRPSLSDKPQPGQNTFAVGNNAKSQIQGCEKKFYFGKWSKWSDFTCEKVKTTKSNRQRSAEKQMKRTEIIYARRKKNCNIVFCCGHNSFLPNPIFVSM